jgi:chorismate-pyruvate lyase
MPLIADALRPRRLDREDVLVDPSLSVFQKVLLLSDGSVTELVSIHAGAEVRVRKIGQHLAIGRAPDLLGGAISRLLHREIMLVARSTDHVYAASTFIVDRLAPEIRSQLLETDCPIGRLWRDARSEMYRDIVELRIEHNAEVAGHFGLPAETTLLARRYVLYQSGLPTGLITETFPAHAFI